ncbi:MAG: PEP-CTERM sorting domain-containing protein [Verrucomicrobia bacterium]|nr:PEP-CTERM sorting domain-containing protein [Verrucomicrobiota bacterium]
MEFHVTGGSVTVETWGHLSEASAETYTVAVPEPSSALLLLIGALCAGLVRRQIRR